MLYNKSAVMQKYETEIVNAFHSGADGDHLERLAEGLRAAHLNICEVKLKAIQRKMATDLITSVHAEFLNCEALWKDLTANEIVRRCVAGIS